MKNNDLRTSIDEAKELARLNMELMDNLKVIVERFFEYVDKYNIEIEGLESLASLVRRAEALLSQITSLPPRPQKYFRESRPEDPTEPFSEKYLYLGYCSFY